MKLTHLLGLALSVFHLCASPGAQSSEAHGLVPRNVRPKSTAYSLMNLGRSNRIILKVVDDAGSRLVGGRLEGGSAGRDLAGLTRRLAPESGLRIRPTIGVDGGRLDDLRRSGETRTGRALADLTEFWSLEADPGTDVRALVLDLLALEVVENAYVAPSLSEPAGGGTPPVPPIAQPYRQAAPLGVDADFANGEPGGRGSGVTILDIETAWEIDHDSLSTPGKGNWAATLHPEFEPTTVPTRLDYTEVGSWNVYAIDDPLNWATGWARDPNGNIDCNALLTDHGTATLGILTAEDDGCGITGLAPDADIVVLSPRTMEDNSIACPFGSFFENMPHAFALAALTLQPGDVVLVERQYWGPNEDETNPCWQFGMVPAEFFDAEFECVRQLTALGIHVVQAAGNGAQDFDDPDTPVGHPDYVTAFDPAFRDSGAILVGAASDGMDHAVRPCSNRGRRVDTYSHGINVATTGYAGMPGGYGWFSGTSSASAIVAACVAVLESTHEQRWGSVLDPIQMRAIVRNSGTPLYEAMENRYVQEIVGRQIDLRDTLDLLRISEAPALNLMGGVSLAVDGFTFPASGSLGQSAAFVDDLDGDGMEDVIVGEPSVGWIYTYSGRTGWRIHSKYDATPGFGTAVAGVSSATDWRLLVGITGPNAEVRSLDLDASGNWSYEFYSVPNAVKFDLENVGDISMDGFDDVAVGYVTANGDGGVKLLSGADLGYLGEPNASLSSPYVRFGWAVAALGDVNGDQVPDFAVSAPDAYQDSQVYVFSGADPFAEIPWMRHAPATGLGETMTGVPDVDGDGRWDVVATSYDSGQGRLHLYNGYDGRHLGTTALQFGTLPATPPASIAAAGDWDGDGSPEVAVGFPAMDTSTQTGAGIVQVYDVDDSELVHVYDGQTRDARFGTALAGGGHLDPDGITDLLVGAPSNGPYATADGHVYGLRSAPADPYGGVDPGPAELVASPAYLEVTPDPIAGTNPQQWEQTWSVLHIDVPAYAGREFMVVGSTSGSQPGTSLHGVEIPVNPLEPGGETDPLWLGTYNAFVLNGCDPTLWPLAGFQGVLDGQGRANVLLGPFPQTPEAGPLNYPPQLWSEGLVYTFSALVVDWDPVQPCSATSNPVILHATPPVEIVLIDEPPLEEE